MFLNQGVEQILQSADGLGLKNDCLTTRLSDSAAPATRYGAAISHAQCHAHQRKDRAMGGQTGYPQPRINDLLRGRVSRFSPDALVNIATAIGRRVRVELEAA